MNVSFNANNESVKDEMTHEDDQESSMDIHRCSNRITASR